MLIYIGNFLAEKGSIPVSAYEVSEGLKSHFQVVCTSHKKNKFLRLCDMCLTLFIQRKKKPTVLIDVYSSSAFYFARITAAICQYYHLPYILIIRGGEMQKRIEKSPKIYSSISEKAKHIVAPSQFMQQVLDHFNIKSKYIPNHIPLEKYPIKTNSSFQYKIVWVRSVHHLYNPQLAYMIFRILAHEFPTLTITYIGNHKDESAEKIMQMSKSDGLEKRVIFTGLLTKQNWHHLASQSDILLNPTQADNFPVSVLECMALGLPVVCSSVGGLTHLVTHEQEGLCIPNFDAEEYAQAIRYIYTHPDIYKRMSTSARKKAEQYSWEKIRPLWLDILN